MSLISKIFGKKEEPKQVSKPTWAAKCSFVHMDNSNRCYYKFIDELDMPLLRKSELDKNLMEMRYGSDLEDVILSMNGALNEIGTGGKIKPNTTAIGFFIKEIEERQKYLLEAKTLFKICANTLIREDEIPYVVDQQILKEKIQTFTNEINENSLYLFFCKVDLIKFLPLSNISMPQFAHLMRESNKRVKAVRATIESLSSEQRSAR